MAMLNLPPIYPITDARLALPLSEQVRRLGEAGFPLVQFRGKPLDAATQARELRLALQASQAAGGWPRICVNDRADLAVLLAAEGLKPWGLHLGQEDLPPSEAIRLPGLAGLHLGTSTHAPGEWSGVDPACDHAGVGPFRATATKGDHAAPVGLQGLREGCARLRAADVAPVAIGGLTLADAESCYAAGAESLAMVGEIVRAGRPGELLWEAQVLRWKVRPPVAPGQGIVLAGGSGAGKSALGAALAGRTRLPFVDLDQLIEVSAGKAIPAIFAEEGEAVFRQMEADHLRACVRQPAVVALGGGAWEREEIRKEVADSGFAALWLAETPLNAWGRVAGDPQRPLAQDSSVFLGRTRDRMARWWELPMVLPLGRDVATLAAALMPV